MRTLAKVRLLHTETWLFLWAPTDLALYVATMPTAYLSYLGSHSDLVFRDTITGT